MVPLPCHISSALERPRDRLGAPCGRPEAESTLRSVFGFEGAEFDAAWEALLALDGLMGLPPKPSPLLAEALSPLGARAAADFADCFSEVGPWLDTALLSKPGSSRLASIERRHQRAAAQLIAMGMAPRGVLALAAGAFVDACLTALERAHGAWASGSIEPLAKLCSCDADLLPRLGSNDILAELAAGTLGGWLYHEATNLAAPKDVLFAPSALRRGWGEGDPPLLGWAWRLCDNLGKAWTLGQGPLLDPGHARRLLGLCDLVDAAPRPELRPAEGRRRLRAELEAGALDESCPAAKEPSQGPRSEHGGGRRGGAL